MTLHENGHTIITVHTWTAIFLEHLSNTSFMASFQAYTESLSGLSLWACILLPCPTQYLAVYLSWLGFTPNTFLLSGWLLANVQVNNRTTLKDIYAHMYIHHIDITILLSFLHIFHSSQQAGWSRPFPSDTLPFTSSFSWHALLTICIFFSPSILFILSLLWNRTRGEQFRWGIFADHIWGRIMKGEQGQKRGNLRKEER